MYLTALVAAAGAGYVAWHLSVYNRLVNFRNAFRKTWSGVEVELKRRLDLIGNLVTVVKGYAAHEAAVLEETARVRARGGSIAPSEAAADSAALKQAVGKLIMVAEAYPDLKAGENFLSLQRELKETEDRIAESRHRYNKAVSLYETTRLPLPNCLVAYVHEFGPGAFFDVPDEDLRVLPEVKFQ